MPEEKSKKRVRLGLWILAFFLIIMTLLWLFSSELALMAFQWKIRHYCHTTLGAQFSHGGIENNLRRHLCLHKGKIEKEGEWCLDINEVKCLIDLDWKERKLHCDFHVDTPVLSLLNEHIDLARLTSSFSIPYFECSFDTFITNGQIILSHISQHKDIHFGGHHRWKEEGWDCNCTFYDASEKASIKVEAHQNAAGQGKWNIYLEDKGVVIANTLFWAFYPQSDLDTYLSWKLSQGRASGKIDFLIEDHHLSYVSANISGTDIVMENALLSLKGQAKDFHLLFETSADSFFGSALNGTFIMHEGKLIPQVHCLDAAANFWKTLGPFYLRESKIVVKNGQIESSSMEAKWLGMQGDLAINWLSADELVHMRLKGCSNEIVFFLPSSFQKKFEKAFPQDDFYLDTAIKRGKQGLDLEGSIEITPQIGEAHHFDFGCQFGKNVKEEKKIVSLLKQEEGNERFLNNLREQFHLSKHRIGWFRGKDIPLEKFLSPILFRNTSIEANGSIDVEGTFDDHCLIVFYTADQIQLESSHFSLVAQEINQKGSTEVSAIHYLDFSTFDHVGVLPLNKISYNQKNLGLAFTEGATVVHFENQKISLRQISCNWKQVAFQGHMEIAIPHLNDVDLKLHTTYVQGPTQEVQEFFSHIVPSVFWKIPLEGEVTSGNEDVSLHFEFKPKSKLVDGYVRGNLSTSFSAEFCRLKEAKVTFEYDVTTNSLLFSNGEGLIFSGKEETTPSRIEIPELAFYNFPFPQVALEMHLSKEGRKIFSCIGHTEGNQTDRHFFLEGDSLLMQGVQKGQEIKVSSFEWGPLKGALDLIIDEKGCDFRELRFQYGELGAFCFDGKMNFQEGTLKGELNNLIIDLNALGDFSPFPPSFEKWISLWNPRGKLCGQGDVYFSFSDKKWFADTLCTFHGLEFGGMHFGDGENLKCHYSSQGLLVEGLEGEIPGKEAPLKYKLGKLHYHYASQKVEFDEFDFSLPPDRLPWVANCATLLFPGKIHPNLVEWMERLKEQESLEGRISVSVFPDHVWAYLTLKDGIYFFNGRSFDLKQFSLLYDAFNFNIQSSCKIYEKEYWTILSLDGQKPNQGTLALLEKEALDENERLVFHWVQEGNQPLHFPWIEGKVSGLTVDLRETATSEKESYFKGIISIDPSRVLHLIPNHLQHWVHKLNLGKGYSFEGDFTFLKDFSDVVFQGEFYGENFILGGVELSSLYSEANFDKSKIIFKNFHIQDKAGVLFIPNAEFRKKEGSWHVNLSAIELQNLRLTQLKKEITSKKSKSLFKSLVIPRLSIGSVEGIIGEKKSFSGKGEMHFTNRTPKNLISNLLLIPSEITARIGLDLSLLVPVRGTIFYEIREGKIYLLNLENMYSEGKRSRFYLVEGTPAYLDFDGNLNFKIKMKQYNLLMKLAEFFTITVKGTLFKPTYTFTNQFDESEQDF